MPGSPTLPGIIFCSYKNIEPYLNKLSRIYVVHMNQIHPLYIEIFNLNHSLFQQILIAELL